MYLSFAQRLCQETSSNFQHSFSLSTIKSSYEQQEDNIYMHIYIYIHIFIFSPSTMTGPLFLMEHQKPLPVFCSVPVKLSNNWGGNGVEGQIQFSFQSRCIMGCRWPVTVASRHAVVTGHLVSFLIDINKVSIADSLGYWEILTCTISEVLPKLIFLSVLHGHWSCDWCMRYTAILLVEALFTKGHFIETRLWFTRNECTLTTEDC